MAPRPLSSITLRCFGWCSPAVAEMAACTPELERFIPRLSIRLLHLVAMALTLRRALPASSPLALGELAGWLTGLPAKEVIARLYGRYPAGTLNCLDKLPQRVLPAESYRDLLTLLEEPHAAKVLWHMKSIGPGLIELLLALDPALRAPAFVKFARKAERVEAFDYLVVALLQIRAAESRTALLASLAHVTSDDGLGLWFNRWVRKAPFPAPPWEGTAGLYPLQSAREMNQAAEAFGNCLRDLVPAVITGLRYYYVSTQNPQAVCELVKDPFLGWALGEMRGPKNAHFAKCTALPLIAAFEAAGFRKLPPVTSLPPEIDPPGWGMAGI